LPGDEPEPAEVEEKLAVVIGDLLHGRLLTGLELGQGSGRQLGESEPDVGDRVSVRVPRRPAERLVDAHLELLGQRVLEAICLCVDCVQADLQRLRQVQLEQAVASQNFERQTLARTSEPNAAIGLMVG
jgi:hypothetical protein